MWLCQCFVFCVSTFDTSYGMEASHIRQFFKPAGLGAPQVPMTFFTWTLACFGSKSEILCKTLYPLYHLLTFEISPSCQYRGRYILQSSQPMVKTRAIKLLSKCQAFLVHTLNQGNCTGIYLFSIFKPEVPALGLLYPPLSVCPSVPNLNLITNTYITTV